MLSLLVGLGRAIRSSFGTKGGPAILILVDICIKSHFRCFSSFLLVHNDDSEACGCCFQWYIHRVGRTARGEGAKGNALLFLIPEEMRFLCYLKVHFYSYN